MPGMFNGIGTTYYGKRDKEPDGSYISTVWFVLLFLPVFPLGSYRIQPTGETDGTYLIIYMSTTERYLVRRIPLNLRQVGNVYLTFYGWIVALFALKYILDTLGT